MRQQSKKKKEIIQFHELQIDGQTNLFNIIYYWNYFVSPVIHKFVTFWHLIHENNFSKF